MEESWEVYTISNKAYPNCNLSIIDVKDVVLVPTDPRDKAQFWYKVPAGGYSNGFALVNIDTLQAMAPVGKFLPVRLLPVPLRKDGTINPNFIKYGGDLLWTKDQVKDFFCAIRVTNSPNLVLDAEDEVNVADVGCNLIRICNCEDDLDGQLWNMSLSNRWTVYTISNRAYPNCKLSIRDSMDVVLAPTNPRDKTQVNILNFTTKGRGFWYIVPAGGYNPSFALVNKHTSQVMVPAGKFLPVRLMQVPLRQDGTVNQNFVARSTAIMWVKDGVKNFTSVIRVFNCPSLVLDAEDEVNTASNSCDLIRTCDCDDDADNQLWNITQATSK